MPFGSFVGERGPGARQPIHKSSGSDVAARGVHLPRRHALADSATRDPASIRAPILPPQGLSSTRPDRPGAAPVPALRLLPPRRRPACPALPLRGLPAFVLQADLHCLILSKAARAPAARRGWSRGRLGPPAAGTLPRLRSVDGHPPFGAPRAARPAPAG